MKVTINGGPWLLGIGRQAWPVFIANVLVTGIAYSAISGSEPGVSSLGPVQRHKTVGVGILGVCLVMLAARLDPFR
jgi:hypothetical protein